LNRPNVLLRLVAGLAFVLVVGTLGYRTLEGWSWLDGLYMTMITITSIGFREVHDLNDAGKIFTMFIIVIGVGLVAYAAVAMTQFVVEGEVGKILSRRQSMKAIERIKNHYIVCGFGRMGSYVCREFHLGGIPFVVVENNPDVQAKVIQAGYLLSPGDASEEDVLIAANIKSAKGLVAVLNSDAANVYTVLTARELSPDLDITARAAEETAIKKLQRAGATKVLSPYQSGGIRIVMGILKPTVMSFLEVAMNREHLDLQLEEVVVGGESNYCGMPLVDTGIRRDLDLIIIAIKKKTGEMVFNPGPQTVIECQDTLITLGERKNLELLAREVGTPS
jgi:voltage-gated potassium channel